MGRIIGWGIALFILFLSSWAADHTHQFFYDRSKPPAAARPQDGPYSISVFNPSQTGEASLEDEGNQIWVYNWKLTAQARPQDVVEFYRALFPTGMHEAEGMAEFDVSPAGARPDEKASVVVAEESQDGQTHFEIEMRKHVDAFVPSYSTLEWGYIFFGIFLLVAMKAGLAQVLARFLETFRMVRGGTKFEMLPAPPADPTIVNGWMGPQQDLQGAGFVQAFDYKVASVQFPNASRVLQRENQTFALLQFAIVKGNSHHWVELVTYFSDGTSVNTTTSRFAGIMTRPEDFPMHVLAEGTDALSVLAAHEQNVSKHEAPPSRVVKLVPTEKLFEVWHEVEVALHEHHKKAGFLTEKGVSVSTGQTPELDAPAPPPPPAVSAPAGSGVVDSEESRTQFRDEIIERIRATYPEMTVTTKDSTTLVITKEHVPTPVDLDITTVFYMYKNTPANREAIIERFVGQLAARIR